MHQSITIIGSLKAKPPLNVSKSNKVPWVSYAIMVKDQSHGKPMESEFHVVSFYKDASMVSEMETGDIVIVKGRIELVTGKPGAPYMQIISDSVSKMDFPAKQAHMNFDGVIPTKSLPELMSTGGGGGGGSGKASGGGPKYKPVFSVESHPATPQETATPTPEVDPWAPVVQAPATSEGLNFMNDEADIPF